MNEEHINKNIVARKRKARTRKAHLRRLQGAYDRLVNDYVTLHMEYLDTFAEKYFSNPKKKWYQFWK
jgi:hypothetical protein